MAVNSKQPETVAVEIPLPSLHVFGRTGKEYRLDTQVFHYKVYTLAGITDLQTKIQAMNLPMLPSPGMSFGEMIVEGAGGTGNYGPMHNFLTILTQEELPEGIEGETPPEDLIAAFDGFFAQSGMKWLDNMVKNFAARASVVMDETLQTAVSQVSALNSDGGTVNTLAS